MEFAPPAPANRAYFTGGRPDDHSIFFSDQSALIGDRLQIGLSGRLQHFTVRAPEFDGRNIAIRGLSVLIASPRQNRRCFGSVFPALRAAPSSAPTSATAIARPPFSSGFGQHLLRWRSSLCVRRSALAAGAHRGVRHWARSVPIPAEAPPERHMVLHQSSGDYRVRFIGIPGPGARPVRHARAATSTPAAASRAVWR